MGFLFRGKTLLVMGLAAVAGYFAGKKSAEG